VVSLFLHIGCLCGVNANLDVACGHSLALLRLWLGLVGARCLLRLPQVFELTNHAFHRTKDNVHPVKRRKR
jgi:hypothetical protein